MQTATSSRQFFSINHPQSDPFQGLIDGFLLREFPATSQKTGPQVIDLVSAEIIGTGQSRLGPKPSVESQVAIRDVIRHWVAKNEPIPFMVPWGSEKPDGSSIDIAELSALKTLSCLYSRVKDHYSPGVVFNIRLEDASAPHLFFEDPDTARKNAARYTGDFLKLVSVLNLPYINPVPESLLVSEERFNQEADYILPAFEAYFTTGEDGSGGITQLGWSGGIAPETVDHYLDSYAKLYPGNTRAQNLHILARYFAAALARRRLKIRGDRPEWGGQFLDLSFASSPPGTDNYFSRRMVYRTIPSNITSQHMPPWRSKGYLLIDGEESRPRLASFNEPKPYNEHGIILDRDGKSVAVRTDYVIA